MALAIKPIGGDSLQVENDTGHWILFTLAFAAARGYAVEHGLIEGT